MSTPAQQYLASFDRRARARLAQLTRQLAGALASGDAFAVAKLSHEGQLLRHGLDSCQRPDNALTTDERVYIAGKLLPLLRDIPTAGSATPPTLVLNPLPARVRGSADAAALTITGTIGGDVGPGAVLLLSRDGVQLQRLAVGAVGPFSFVDPAPGRVYRVELTGTGLVRERARPLVSGVRFGVLPSGASATQLAALPLSADSFADGVARFAFVGARNRIFLLVPTSLGTVTKITQPSDQDADITAAFSRSVRSLSFGPDGADEYEVLENSADFLGPFTLDAHL